MKLLPHQPQLQWSFSHNNHTFSEAPPTPITPSVKLLPQQSHLQWSSSHNNHSFSEAPPTTITSSVKLLPQQPQLQWSSSHCSSAINAGIFPSVYKWRRTSEHQFEVKSADKVYWRTERTWEIQNPAEWNALKNKQVCVYSWFFSNEAEKQ